MKHWRLYRARRKPYRTSRPLYDMNVLLMERDYLSDTAMRSPLLSAVTVILEVFEQETIGLVS